MFKNYLLIAFRNIVHQRFYAALNIIGLAIGLAGFILIALWVKDELNYDAHFKNADRIYRVENSLVTHGVAEPAAAADSRIPGMLRRDFPDIGPSTCFYKIPSLLSAGKLSAYESDTYYADSGFFSVFSYRFAEGKPQKALLNDRSVVITEQIAGKIFGKQSALGKKVFINNTQTKDSPLAFTVTGVLATDDRPSHFHPAIIIAKYRRIEVLEPTYVLLNEGYDTARFRTEVWQKMYDGFFRQKYQPDDQDLYFDRLQPITNIHLSGNKWEELEQNGDINLLYIFSAIAIILLVVACINYINLATARSFSRAREVGVRKVLGATRRQLILQFLTESVVLCLIALILALSLAEMTLPYFNKLSGKIIILPFASLAFIAGVLAMAVAVGIISGLYPAFSIISFQPARSLQGSLTIGSGNPVLRKVLVVAQFSISIVMLIATIVIAQQLNFVKHRDLGFDKDRMLLVDLNDQRVNAQKEAFKDSLRKNPDILRVSAAYNVPGSELNHTYINIEADTGFVPILTNSLFVDYDYVDVMGLTLKEGRDFDSSMIATLDTSAYLIANESAARMLGGNVVGKKVETGYYYGMRRGHIIGVVKNFHAASLHDTIKPIFLSLGTVGRPEGRTNFLSIKVKAGKLQQTIAYVGNAYQAWGQGSPFKYTLLDEAFNKQYEKEEKQRVLFNWLTGLSIFISVLGLIGLTAFFMRQRAKEISIRKISGATLMDILLLLSRDFIRLVFISLLFAMPLAYFIMKIWLSNFAYHISISWIVFAISAFTMIAMVTVTVYVQLIFAYYKRPAAVLRHE